MVLIYSTKVRGVGSDNLCWKPASSRGFKVSGYYHSISSSTGISFPWKMVLAIEGSSSSSFFLLDCSSRQDSNYRQPSEEAFCCP